MKNSDILLLARGYITEIAVSALVLGITACLVPSAALIATLQPISGRLAILTGGLSAASFGLLGVYFSQTSSEFGKYLSWRGVSAAYLKVFGIASIYHVAGTLCLILLTTVKSYLLALLCVFMLSLSLANVISTVGNLVSIIKLRDLFNKEFRKVES